MPDASVTLKISDVRKTFPSGNTTLEVLRGVSLELHGGEALAITGPSGSGKSTLLHLLGALDGPTAGRVEVNGQMPYTLPEAELARFRNQTMGFVFQDHHLLPQYSVLENVLIPALAFGNHSEERTPRALSLLERVGLSDRLHHRPAALSGGERQRVAIARALINQPALLLCDEPTGNLDQRTATAMADLIFELHAEEQNILIVVTHSLELAARFQRRLDLRDGLLVAV